MSHDTETPRGWRRAVTALAGRLGKWPVLTAWILLAYVGVTLGAKVADVENNDISAWLPASAESTAALDVAEREFPDDGTRPLIVVYSRPGGVTDADTAAAQADLSGLSTMAVPGSGAPSPIPSDDGEALMLVVSIPAEASTEDAAAATLDRARSIADAGLPAGLEYRLTGPIAAEADFDEAFDSIDGTLMAVTAAVVAVLLLITYRSPLLLLLPLVSVGVASQLANAAVYLLAEYAGMVVTAQSSGILTVLVFGAGTDYALLLISRYREELHRSPDQYAAMRVALPRTLPAIVASAGTVILAMLVLLFADMNSTSSLGPVAAVGIAAALLAMTTLLPALLVLCGRRVFWPLVPRHDPDAVHGPAESEHRIWTRVARFVRARPRPIWIVTALALAALTLGVTSLQPGLTESESFTTKPGSIVGQELLAEHYPAGATEPVEIYAKTASAPAVAAAVAGVDGVSALDEQELSADGEWTLIPAVLADDPGSVAARSTVERIRTVVHDVDAGALVGGETALALDQSATTERDLWVLIPLILLVVFVVLILLLRALVAPLLLLASVVLSYGAALGGAGLVLDAMGFPKTDGNLQLFGFLFLVALGVDYTIFLMTRAREEAARIGHADGIPHALAVTGGVITSAGIVLAATFSALAILPIVFLLQIGVVVAVGVLLDTLVVRSLLVPALALDVGRRSWWPGRLAKAAPEPVREPALNR